MRTLILFFSFLGFTTLQAQNLDVESEIKEVVVYLNGAQITRTAQINIPAGKSELLFKGLTSRLNTNSLQVASGKEITILSVNHSFDFMAEATSDARIVRLTRQRDALKDSIDLMQNASNVFVKEREMLLSNQTIGGAETGVDVDQLIKAADFFRKRLTQIEESIFANNQTIKKMKERLEKLNRQLGELNATKDQPTSTVKVTVSAPRAVTTSMLLTYTVRDAYWQPFYDIRVEDTNEPITLVYKAKVFQNTQESWDNVMLTLSTGNPSISNYKPELQPWFLDFQRPAPMKSIQVTEDDLELNEMAITADAKKGKPLLIRGTTPLKRTNVTVARQQTTTAFQINIPYTIPSDNQGYDVAVSDHTIEAGYQYATAPKLSPHVYLVAHISQWSNLNLLPGEANIYLNQTYQGKTFLDPYTSEDTLKVSVGRDPAIVVKRELLKDYSSKSFLGNNHKETKAWKITVKNSKDSRAKIMVEDQYPVSSNSEIKIDLEESSGARVNSVTGKIVWELNLSPGETKELRLIYSVRYPKERNLVID